LEARLNVKKHLFLSTSTGLPISFFTFDIK